MQHKDKAMNTAETGIKTVIHVVSASPHAVVVQYPADTSTGIVLLFIGLMFLLGGYASLYKHRAEMMQGFRWLLWLVPLLCALLPVVFGIFKATTVITMEASVETGMLTVRHMVAGSLADSTAYPLADVQGVQIGFGRGCKYLYANLADGSDPKLLPCSPRTGYSEVAHTLNSFLNSPTMGRSTQ